MVGVETDQPSAGLAAEEFALGDHRCGDRTGGSGHPSLIIERRSQAVSAGWREYEVAGIAVLRFRLFRDQNVGGTAQNFASARLEFQADERARFRRNAGHVVIDRK